MPGTASIEIFLQPGEYFVGDASFRVRTLLGSCVSVALWAPARQFGAMSHVLLPSRPKTLGKKLDGRYGEESLILMLQELKVHGVRAGDCTAKIFGGGNMFPGQKRSDMRIGEKNGESAKRLLALHQIPVVSQCLYGDGHRQIIFDISTGHVWSRQIKQAKTTEPAVAASRGSKLA